MDDRPVLHFHGAAGTVTGSCQLVEAGGLKILVDCGLFQGSKTEKELNYRPFPFVPAEIHAVILTHAHIDHSGLLPKLVKNGFDGPIYATPATRDLCGVMLPDSGHIQEVEVENLNRRNRRRGKAEVVPIYTADDATIAVTQFRPVEYDTWQSATDFMRFRFSNAGHLLGSASVEMEITTGGDVLRLLFSGDIGPENKLLQDDPEAPSGFDHVICESTYGDEDREDKTEEQRRDVLRNVVKDALHDNGALIIPSFAVERTRELIADLHALMETRAIPTVPVIIDSPLATRASEIFQNHARELNNGAMLARAMRSRNIRFTESVEQSKALDNMRGFHIIIAASGMCEAGRIRHRLKNWLWRDEGTILLVGYQATGTLGRILQEGAATVRIQGDDIKVRARIRQLDLYSGHADGPELAGWVKQRLPIKGGVFMVHGEGPAIEGLHQRLAAFIPDERLRQPYLDSAWRLGHESAEDISEKEAPARLQPASLAHLDWHNDIQALILDIQDELGKAADDKARAVVIRKLRRALSQ